MILKINIMNEINEIKLPKGVDRIAVKQHDDKIVIEFIPKEAKFKIGDILKSTITPELTVIFDKMTSTSAFDSIYNNGKVSNHDWYLESFRHATEEEKQEFFDELEADGKRWNAEKKCIEDIPKRKFKKGDKVRIKEGISSKTHRNIPPLFVDEMDDLIGKTMTVDRYTDVDGYVVRNGSGWCFHEDWLEPYEELKKGDLAIFWDDVKAYALIRIYDRGCHEYHCDSYGTGWGNAIKFEHHYDSYGTGWRNAIKFESKEQFEKVLRGEI